MNDHPAVQLTDEAVDEIRQNEFPAAGDTIHLKASGGSPMCRSAFDAQERYLRQMCFEGDLYYSDYLTEMDCARARIAAYIGASPEEIAFTVNSSSAASIVTAQLVRAEVRRVYYPVSEFPTSVHALAHTDIELVPVGDPEFRDGGDSWLEAVSAHLIENPTSERCALVASHVCYLSGATLDIAQAAALCKRHGMLFVLNATQSFGALSIDVGAGVDMLYATGLKWAFAGYGAGILYLRQSSADALGLPSGTGWLSVEDPYRMDNRNTAPVSRGRSLDAGGGMPHFGPLLGLNGSLAMYERIGNGDIRAGIAAVEARLLESASYLRSKLHDAGADLLGPPERAARSGIVSMVSVSAKDISARLAADKILVSLRTVPGKDGPSVLRFGVHFFNTKGELNRALSVMGLAEKK